MRQHFVIGFNNFSKLGFLIIPRLELILANVFGFVPALFEEEFEVVFYCSDACDSEVVD